MGQGGRQGNETGKDNHSKWIAMFPEGCGGLGGTETDRVSPLISRALQS